MVVDRTSRLGIGIFGIFGLSVGYFLWYTPYAGLTKALSSGLLPGIDGQVGGLVLLPATALGTLVGCAIFLAVSGWWRHAFSHAAGSPARWPRRTTVVAGFFMALIIMTTTLNYTFAGVSILFMLLMMRGGVLALSPAVDAVRGRRVYTHSWVALGLCLLAVIAVLSEVGDYHLTAAAVLSLATYFVGYIGRFEIMSRVSKTEDAQVTRRYLVEEQVAAVVWQVALCGLLALVGTAATTAAVRQGFTVFLVSAAVVPAFIVGLLYAGLFVCGTLIYLHPREFTWCVPANRSASLLSGVVASYALTWLVDLPPPGPGQLVATGLIGLAAVSLSYPALSAVLVRRRRVAPRQLLFVCGGNTGRSAMAEAIARAEIARVGTANGGGSPRPIGLTARSAGLSPRSPGTPMAAEAVAALRDLGMPVHPHRSRQLTWQMCQDSTVVYCMTQAQHAAVAEIAPEARDRTFCLDPGQDIPDPATAADPVAAYQQVAELIQRPVRAHVRELLAHPGSPQPQPQPVGGA